MAYLYGSQAYRGSFSDLPGPPAGLRESAVAYVKAFDVAKWSSNPMVTILRGQRYDAKAQVGSEETTTDYLGKPNGRQLILERSLLPELIAHTRNYKAPKQDYRTEARAIEAKFMALPLAAELIGNQAVDFGKQDGITEIEESVQANLVEQRLNDALRKDEEQGLLTIRREAAFIGCVSNFTNFLDLCRKVLRNLELGVPVVVLSRSNVAQHMFRWTERLLELMAQHGIPSEMVTFASCSLEMQLQMFAACPEHPAYYTCSRAVARAAKKNIPLLVASTGGPNTLVCGGTCAGEGLTDAVLGAVRTSNCIENKGQCTALRVACLPGADAKTVERMYAPTKLVSNVADSMERSQCADLFQSQPSTYSASVPGYTSLPNLPVQYKLVNDFSDLQEVPEYWRQAVVDVVSPPLASVRAGDPFVERCAAWIRGAQPISLAVNGDLELAVELFERTALVVYTYGTKETPALTAQARPQDGEIFGEFPPRKELEDHTHLPVHVPSSTPGYRSFYTADALAKHASAWPECPGSAMEPAAKLQALLRSAGDVARAGYLGILATYLVDSLAKSPVRSLPTAGRTSLNGWQNLPIGQVFVLRVGKGLGLAALPYVLPFEGTSARASLVVSAAEDHPALAGLRVIVEGEEAFRSRVAGKDVFGTAVVSASFDPCLVSHWVSRLLPMGHFKSTTPNDDAFVARVRTSSKWLALAPLNRL